MLSLLVLIVIILLVYALFDNRRNWQTGNYEVDNENDLKDEFEPHKPDTRDFLE